jgi:hypothetical protein
MIAPGVVQCAAPGTADATEAANRQPAAGISFSCRKSSLLLLFAEAQGA